jgi:hypothetical protein
MFSHLLKRKVLFDLKKQGDPLSKLYSEQMTASLLEADIPVDLQKSSK